MKSKHLLLMMLLMAMFAPWAVGQKALPYSYGFENNDLTGEGWTKQASSSSTAIYNAGSSNAHGGSYLFRFYYTENPAYLKSPLLSGTDNGVDVVFFYKQSSSSYIEKFKVGYTTDETITDLSAFTYGDEISTTTSWQKYSNTFPANTKYIAIQYIYTNGMYLWLDDFSFTVPASCPKPTLSDEVTTTSNTATITWTPSSSDQVLFDIYWSTTNTAPDVNTTPSAANQSGTSYTIENLTPATTYYVWLRGNCGTATEPIIDGGWTEAIGFTTECGTINAGYSNYFDTETSGQLPQCWSRPSNTSTSYPVVYNYSTYAHSGSQSLRFVGNTSTTAQIGVLPEVGRTLNGLRLSFYAMVSTAGNYTLSVGYMTDANNKDSFTEVQSFTPGTSYQTEAYTVDFGEYTNDPRFIAIRSNMSTYYTFYVDDIELTEIPDCDKPTGLTASAGDDAVHSVNLSWTSTASSWDISYSTTSGDPDNGTIIENIENNPYTLTGLTGGVTYYAYVRANCASGESEWSVVKNFTTTNGCGTPTNLTATAIPGGAILEWNDGDNTPESWQVAYSTSYGSTPPANSTIVDIPTNPYTLEGLNYGASYYSWVRTVCDGNDGTSEWSSYRYFTTLAQFPAPTIVTTSPTPDGAVVTWNKGYSETQWQIQLGVYENYSWTYTIVDEILNEQTYTFTGLTEQTNYRVQVRAYIDAEHQSSWSNAGSFTTLASCPKPTNLNYSNLTATTVELDWTKGYQETAWNIQYKAGNAEWATIENITDKPYTMTVSDATTYQVKIQNSCESDWSNTITFTTPCLPNTTFPFEEDFENLTTSGEIPGCWDNSDGSNISANYKWCYYANGTSYGSTVSSGVDGSKCIRFNSYNTSVGDINYLKTPVMNFPTGKTMVLGFYWKNPAGGELSVYISTDGGDTYTTELKTGMAGGQTTWKEEEIELTNYVGTENVVIVFKGYSNSGAYNTDAYIYLDNVTISEKNDCAKPKDLAVSSYDNHSATLSWDANDSEGPWQVAYSTTENFDLDDPTAYSIASATTNPFTLTGLTNLNTYYVRVRAICGENYSEWNNNGYQSFTTEATFTTPTITGISEIGDQSATVAWETGNSEETPTHWTVWYKTGNTENTKTVEATNTSTQITGLTAGSTYEVKVRAQSGDDYSAWSVSENFQTAFCAAENQCNITYELTDSANDGWNGSYIKVVYKATNFDIAHITFTSGSSYSSTLALCDGAEYDFVWVKDSYFDYECGFTIKDVNNEIIFEHESGTAPTNGATLFTYTMNCTVETCTRPSDLTADAVHPNSAELSWTSEAGQNAWQIAYSTESFDPNAANFDLTTVSVADADSNPFELEGLDNSQTYYAYVRAVCGTDDYSKWSTTACEFTTQVVCPAPTNVYLASRPASTQLAIAWTAGYEETDWNLYYRVAGAEEWGEPVAVAATPAYTITGELSTTYEVKVAAVCSGEEGGASDVVTFSTPINVTVASSFSENFNQSGCPSGWTAVSGVHNSYTYSWTFGGTLASSSNYSEMYLVTPLLHISDLTPMLSFAQKRSSSGSSANISVKVSTTGIEKTDFTETVWSGTTGDLTTSNKTQIADLSTFVGQDVYIAFFYNGTGGHYWHIDDVAVTIGNTFRTAGNWDDAANWSEKVPTIEDNVIIAAVATIPNGTIATANNITISNGSLTIADGGQLKHNNEGVTATLEKNIIGYTGEKDHYYMLGFPNESSLSPEDVINMVSTPENQFDFDLYYFDQTETTEWLNYEDANANSDNFWFFPTKGYLYGRSTNTTLSATVELTPSNEDYVSSLEYEDAAEFKGWNLVANPFMCNAYIGRDFYRMVEGDLESELTPASGAIAPLEGVFVKANDTEDNAITFSREEPVNTDNLVLNLNLIHQNSFIDLARVRFSQGNGLEKFQLNPNHTKIYIPMDGKDYAVVNAGKVGEIPVSFKAEKNGSYTLSFTSQEVSFSYLHLIDNLTGDDVDLLVNPSYSFNAKTTDYASRFRLVFATGSSTSSESGSFAFINGMGNLSIFGIEGEATIQVIDILGRVLSSDTFSGSYERKLNVAPGVYMIRLINGNDVKTQKIVVR